MDVTHLEVAMTFDPQSVDATGMAQTPNARTRRDERRDRIRLSFGLLYVEAQLEVNELADEVQTSDLPLGRTGCILTANA